MFSWLSGNTQTETTETEDTEEEESQQEQGGWLNSIQEYASRITDTVRSSVADSAVFTEFEKKQKQFVRQQQREKDAALPPWVGYNEEEQMRAQMLQLSTDRRNVLRPPPSGVQFHFDFKQSYPVAMAVLAEDPQLQKLRFELVPKKLTEEQFWKNYFYRISLIKQSLQVSLCQSEPEQEDVDDHAADKLALLGNSDDSGKDHPQQQLAAEDDSSDQQSVMTEEFASDDVHAPPSGGDRQHHMSLNEELGQLGVLTTPTPQSPDDIQSDPSTDLSKSSVPQWEEELAKELEDLEVLGEGTMGDTQLDRDEWEHEIEQMLEVDSDTNPD